MNKREIQKKKLTGLINLARGNAPGPSRPTLIWSSTLPSAAHAHAHAHDLSRVNLPRRMPRLFLVLRLRTSSGALPPPHRRRWPGPAERGSQTARSMTARRSREWSEPQCRALHADRLAGHDEGWHGQGEGTKGGVYRCKVRACGECARGECVGTRSQRA